MQLVRSGFCHHVHVHAADRDGRRCVVGHDLKLIERIVVGIKLCVTAVCARPVQVQTVIAINLLCLRASMDLHGGLLVAVIASDIERAGGNPRHLRNGGPGIAAARNVLQQRLVEGGRGLRGLQVNDRFAFHLNGLA